MAVGAWGSASIIPFVVAAWSSIVADYQNGANFSCRTLYSNFQ